MTQQTGASNADLSGLAYGLLAYLLGRGEQSMPYRKDRARRARENAYFVEKDRRLIQRLRARLRNLEGSAPKSKGSGRTARKDGAVSKTYLVPVDFSKSSEVALQHARGISRENNAKLVLLHVLNKNLFHPRKIMPKSHTEKQTRGELKRLADRMRLQPSEYRPFVAWGRDMARTIATHAQKLQASMIIMGNHGRTGLTRLMLGSVAERTLRYAECPVLIVKNKAVGSVTVLRDQGMR